MKILFYLFNARRIFRFDACVNPCVKGERREFMRASAYSNRYAGKTPAFQRNHRQKRRSSQDIRAARLPCRLGRLNERKVALYEERMGVF